MSFLYPAAVMMIDSAAAAEKTRSLTRSSGHGNAGCR